MTQQKRKIIITGGNSGIGRAIAERFAQEEAHLAILGRDQETLRATASALAPHATWYQADVSQRQQVQAAVATIVEQWGQVDVLVNAAAIYRVLGVTADMPLDEAEGAWDAVLDINLKGSFLMTVAVAPHLVRPGGRIIYISSIAAFTGGSRTGLTAYAAAKAGLLGLTYGFARELSPQGITVNAVAPGFIANTGITGAWSEERVRGIIEQTPVGRAGQVNDVAAAVHYLSSPEAAFVTGEVLNVNGGWLGH